jgi:hypothetical protein
VDTSVSTGQVNTSWHGSYNRGRYHPL